MRTKLLVIVPIAALLSAFLISAVYAATVFLPSQGGTGTGITPTYGQVLMGNGSGVYTPVSTSSLGIFIGSSFSTTSTNYWSSVGLSFSTSSTDYWLATKSLSAFSTTSGNFWAAQGLAYSTTSTTYDLSTYDKGYFFSTTSANAWDATKGRWATTSANYHASVGLAFSTTSTDYWLTTKSVVGFSTTSASYFSSLGLAFSTTSALAHLTTLDKGFFFSTSSANYYGHASTTIPKTYTANTFALTQTFTLAPVFTALTGVLKGNGGSAASVAVDGTDFTLIDVSTCSAGLGHVSVTAAGVFTCGNTFSTTSAAYFTSVGLSFSTTSTDYWLSTKGIGGFSTTSANYWASVGLAFSTTSANYASDIWAHGSSTLPKTYSVNTFTAVQGFTGGLVSTQVVLTGTISGATLASSSSLVISGVPSCSGSNALQTSSVGLVSCGAVTSSFSTTSANFWSSVGLGFSTTSSNYWSSLGLSFSTTSALAHLTTIDKGFFYSTTSENYYQNASPTVATMYKINTFTGTNSFQNITATGATTTAFSTGSASTTNLFGTSVFGFGLTTCSGSNFLQWSGGVFACGAPAGGSSFSTTSADYWKTQNNFFSTTSTAYYAGVGLSYSTTSTLADLTTYNKGFFFSTTSASAFLAQNQGNAFSTTSANYWSVAGLGFSTTSANFWSSLGLGFSSTSANYASNIWAHGSTTLPKTYTANTFSLAQTFTLAPIFSAHTGVVIGNGGSASTAGSAQTCTNQFIRSMSALYVATCATVSLTVDISGVLPIANGGTNASSIGSHMLVTSDGTRMVSTSTPTMAALFATSTTATSSIASNLLIGAANTNYFTNAPLVLTANTNNYGQLVLQNLSNGIGASADFVVGGDKMTNSSYFADFGCNSSGNTDAAFTAYLANDCWLYSKDSNLHITTASSTGNANILFETGGTLLSNERMRITATGNVGIASSTPWAKFSVANPSMITADYFKPLLVVGTSSASTAFALSAWATSTVLSSSLGSNVPYSKSAQTVAVGSPFQYGLPQPVDTLYVDGTISSSWHQVVCDAPRITGNSLTAAAHNAYCGMLNYGVSGTGFTTSASAVFGEISTVISTGVNGGATTAAAGGSMSLNAGNGVGWLIAATSSPQFEAIVRISVPQQATSSLYTVGITDYNGFSGPFSVMPTEGCFFNASSTSATGNWYAVALKSGGTMTFTDTGVASSTSLTASGMPYKMRVEMDATKCNFYIQQPGNGSVSVAKFFTIGGNSIATTTSLTPSVTVGATAAGNNKTIGVFSWRLWWKDSFF